jgi:hypothetical protein
VIGRTCKLLQGKDTEIDRVQELMIQVKHGRAGSTVLTNYTSEGDSLTILLRVYPLYIENSLTHYLGDVEPIQSKDHNGNTSTSGHTTEGSTGTNCSAISTYKESAASRANVQDQEFFHSLILPQASAWIKKDQDRDQILQNSSQTLQSSDQNPLKYPNSLYEQAVDAQNNQLYDSKRDVSKKESNYYRWTAPESDDPNFNGIGSSSDGKIKYENGTII